MTDLERKVKERIATLLEHAKKANKKTAFIIGNTTKKISQQSYFIPQRDVPLMVTAGVIVYSERDAREISKIIDGKVDYVLVDAEKKITDADSETGEPGNIERVVRENVRYSRLWTFKGNDLSVEAADALLTNVFDNEIAGIGGKHIAIIGCGNLGTKLALKLVERGAHVRIARRNHLLLAQIEAVINSIKPIYTTSDVCAYKDNEEACVGADVIIGVSQGLPVITENMIKNSASNLVLLDIGKGSIEKKALSSAIDRGLLVYRLDISCAMAGVITKLFLMDHMYQNSSGRRKYSNEYLVAGGVMGRYGDIVVDSIRQPQKVYGVADGFGDFIRPLDVLQQEKLKQMQERITNEIE